MRGQRDSYYSRVSHDGYDRVATLLPLRTTGPPTDVSSAIEALWGYQRPQSLFVPNLPSVAEQIRPSSNTRAVTQRASPPPATQPSPTPAVKVAVAARAQRSPPLRRASAEATPGRSPRGRVSRRIRQENAGEVTLSERVRFRNEVSRKLMDLYDEAVELDDCSDNMVAQLTDAMCADPRRAREVFGFVRLTPRPTDEQQAALDGVTEALATLRAACVELVAAYLTPEEKRHLGVDPNLFQTRAERSTTYQYGPSQQQQQKRASFEAAQRKEKGKEKEKAGPERRPADDSSMTTATFPVDADDASEKRQVRERTADPAPAPVAHTNTKAKPRGSVARASSSGLMASTGSSPLQRSGVRQDNSGLPAATGLGDTPGHVSSFNTEPASQLLHHVGFSASPPGSILHADPQPVPGAAATEDVDEADAAPTGDAADEDDDAAEAVSGAVEENEGTHCAEEERVATPAPLSTLPAPAQLLHRDSDSDSDDAAVGTPERQIAPTGNASVSSLGGGSTTGPSPIRPATVAAAPITGAYPVAPAAVAGPAAPKAAPHKLLLKKAAIPPGAKLVPFPMPMRKIPVQPPPPSAAVPPPAPLPSHAPQLAPGVPAYNAQLTGPAASLNGSTAAALSAPPSALRPKQAPTVPMTRPEFRKFMIDTDSESLP